MRIPGKSCACCASAFASRDRSSAGLVLLLNDVPVDALAARIGLEFELDTQIAFETVTGSRRLVARVIQPLPLNCSI